MLFDQTCFLCSFLHLGWGGIGRVWPAWRAGQVWLSSRVERVRKGKRRYEPRLEQGESEGRREDRCRDGEGGRRGKRVSRTVRVSPWDESLLTQLGFYLLIFIVRSESIQSSF